MMYSQPSADDLPCLSLTITQFDLNAVKWTVIAPVGIKMTLCQVPVYFTGPWSRFAGVAVTFPRAARGQVSDRLG